MGKPNLLKTQPPFTDRATQLSRHSTPYRDPLARIHWERLSEHLFWLPEQAVSLYGIEQYDALPLDVRKRLSHYEFARFLSAGVWLESLFLQRLARAALKGPRATRIYHLHELREEAGHSLMFLEFFERTDLDTAVLDAPFDPWLTALGRRLPFHSTLFWSAILLGEEIPDRLNRYVRLHAQSVCPVAIEICALHSTDEARHIAYGREVLRDRLERAGSLTRILLGRALNTLLHRFVTTFYYPPQSLYIHAGLPAGPWAARVATHPARQQFVAHCLGPTVARLRGLGLTVSWP